MKEIQLNKGQVALVDDQFYDRLAEMGPWHVNSWGYAVKDVPIDGKRKRLRMNRVVMELAGLDPGPRCDHRDGNRLNNQLANLRAADASTNGMNRGPQRNNPVGGLKGVRPSGKRFTAIIGLHGKDIYLGSFPTAVEAARAYDAAALKYHGEFARPNFTETTAA